MKKELITILICILFVAIVFTPCINAENKNTETLPIQYDEFENKIEEIENKFYSAGSEEERVVILKEMVILCDEYGLLPNDMTVEQAEQLMIKNYIDEEQRYDTSVFPQDRYMALDGQAVLPTNSIHRCNLGYVSPVSILNKQSGFSLEKSNLETTLRQTSTMNIPRRTGRGMGPIEVVSSECPGDSQGSLMVIDSEGTIHVAWTDDTDINGADGDSDIFYKTKSVGGDWSSVEVVTAESAYPSAVASLAVDTFGNVHMAGLGLNTDENKYYGFYMMKPFGGNWSPAELIFPDNHDYWDGPYLACDAEGTVHVVWCANNSGDWDIFYRNKPIGGSWSPVEVVSKESNRFPDYPALAVEPDGTVHVVWSECYYGLFGSQYPHDIFYKKRSSDGKWSTPKIVSTEGIFVYSIAPSIVIGSDGAVHIAWTDLRGISANILYRIKSPDGTWSRIERITTNALTLQAELAVGSDGTVHAVWAEAKLWYPWIVPSIFYNRKPSGGAWMTDAEMVSLECDTSAQFPQIAIGPNEDIVHITWTDFTDYYGQDDSDADIVYRMKPVVENQPPTKPTVVGPTIIKSSIFNDYEIMSTDPDGDDVFYYIDCEAVIYSNAWISDLLGPYNSSKKINISFMWPWPYTILIFKARAVDVNGAWGDWTKFVVIVLQNLNNNMNSEPAYNQQNSQSSQQGNQGNRQFQSSLSSQFIQMVTKTTNR